MRNTKTSPAKAALSEAAITRLRATYYNARLLSFRHVHDDLAIFRVIPDGEPPSHEPGQYTIIGLGDWEPRVAGVQGEPPGPAHVPRLIRRAYSFSCPMLDNAGRLLPPDRCEFLEFYIALVRQGADHPPGLTPRLFALQEGDRLHLGPKVTGHYTLGGVKPSDNVVLVATGTGEAPHNTMVAHLLSRGHRGRIAALACVRWRRDLAYLETYRELDRRFENFRYLWLTTREPENLDPAAPDYVGRRYVQDYFRSGEFESDAGLVLDPATTHVYLCGNPAMIGAPTRGAQSPTAPLAPQGGMVELLQQRGFEVENRDRAGNIHYEKYW